MCMYVASTFETLNFLSLAIPGDLKRSNSPPVKVLHNLSIIMILHNLPLIIPPRDTNTNHPHQSPIRHIRLKLRLVASLQSRFHIVERQIPFPRCEVLVTVDGDGFEIEVGAGGEHVGEEGVDGRFVEVEHSYTWGWCVSDRIGEGKEGKGGIL